MLVFKWERLYTKLILVRRCTDVSPSRFPIFLWKEFSQIPFALVRLWRTSASYVRYYKGRSFPSSGFASYLLFFFFFFVFWIPDVARKRGPWPSIASQGWSIESAMPAGLTHSLRKSWKSLGGKCTEGTVQLYPVYRRRYTDQLLEAMNESGRNHNLE